MAQDSAAQAPALPRFPARDDHAHVALEASRAVVALYLQTGSTDHPIAALAAHTGLSERTFYRVFPRKEDAVRPYIEAGLAHVVAAVREAPPDQPLRDALIDAHGGLLDASAEGATLLRLLHSDARLRAMWGVVLTDAERAFAEVIALRLGRSPDSLPARLAGAAVVAAGRLALQRPEAETRSPSQTFAAALDLLGPVLFAPRPRSPSW